jgi:DNA-binding HxlR family transcriptional regulator
MARQRWNAFDPSCPTRQLLDRLADKWTVLVVCALQDEGPTRFGALRRRLGGVAPKVLTAVLRSLERDGVVTRTVYTGSPLRVDYRLTTLGESLHDVVEGLRVWAESNITGVQVARRRYERTRIAEPPTRANRP